MTDIAQAIKRIIMDELGVEEEQVYEKARFVDDLVVDSLNSVALVVQFEEEFDIEIPDGIVEKIKTVGDLIRFVTDSVSAAQPT